MFMKYTSRGYAALKETKFKSAFKEKSHVKGQDNLSKGKERIHLSVERGPNTECHRNVYYSNYDVLDVTCLGLLLRLFFFFFLWGWRYPACCTAAYLG
jgi:hypothetical protein